MSALRSYLIRTADRIARRGSRTAHLYELADLALTIAAWAISIGLLFTALFWMAQLSERGL